MKLIELAKDAYQIVACMEGDACPVAVDLFGSNVGTYAYRMGLVQMLEHIASNGFQGLPSKKCHLANRENGIYELIKGNQRLFFFHGEAKQIVVCTSLATKQGQKANKQSVKHAIRMKAEYMAANSNQTLEVVENEDE